VHTNGKVETIYMSLGHHAFPGIIMRIISKEN